MKNEDFITWLLLHKDIKEKSARDISSRLNRVKKISVVDLDLPYEKIIHNLSKNEEFISLKPTIRSQLRRALKLYKDFQKQ